MPLRDSFINRNNNDKKGADDGPPFDDIRRMEEEANEQFGQLLKMLGGGIFDRFEDALIPNGSFSSSSSHQSTSSVFRMLPDGSTERTTRVRLPDGNEEVTITKCDPQQICETMKQLISPDNQVISDTSKSLRDTILIKK